MNVEMLQLARLKCLHRNHPCRVAFVGDAASTRHVHRGCEALFTAGVQTVDFTPCWVQAGMVRHTSHVRNWLGKVCVRAHRWSPFQHTIVLDMDTLVLSDEIEQIFPVLSAGFDLTAVFECCAFPDPHHDPRYSGAHRTPRTPLLHGWEMHTGVVGYTDTAHMVEHANASIRIWGASGQIRGYSSFEQQAETLALARSSLRWLPLPATFAVRRYTVTAAHQLPRAVAHFKWDPNGAKAEALRAMAKKRADHLYNARGRPPLSDGFDPQHWSPVWDPA